MNRTPATRRLSSSLSTIYKRVFPRLVLVLGTIAAGLMLWAPATGDSAGFPWAFVVLFAVVLGGIYAITNIFTSGVADAVFDGGDHLRVRIGDAEEVILMREIESVHESIWSRQPRIELLLKYPGKFGRVIAFIPARYSLVPFSRSALFYELEERVRIASAEAPPHVK
jgi:hypothetical protein